VCVWDLPFSRHQLSLSARIPEGGPEEVIDFVTYGERYRGQGSTFGASCGLQHYPRCQMSFGIVPRPATPSGLSCQRWGTADAEVQFPVFWLLYSPMCSSSFESSSS